MRDSKIVVTLLGLLVALLLFAPAAEALSIKARVADGNTAIPNGTGTFTGFFDPVLSGGTVAFRSFGSSGPHGIYLFDGSTLSRVADLNTTIPNGTGTFTGFFTAPVLSGDTVAFQGFSSGRQGIYLFDGSTLSRVADNSTGIPNGIGGFSEFGPPVLSGNTVAFRGGGFFGPARDLSLRRQHAEPGRGH